MGSLRALVVLASLSGCDTSGVEIVVLPPGDGAPAPDQIRLFLGNPDETEGAIAPESFGLGAERPGWIWTRDTRDVADVVPVAGGESVSFGFVAESDHTEIGAIIAVGYTDGVATSAGSLFHVKTGVGNVRVFDLQLRAAVDPRQDSNRTALLQVEVWGPSPGDETCVHLFNMHPDRDMVDPHDVAFIVTKDDRDCDGYVDDDGALECAADVHDAVALPEPEDLSCAVPVPNGINPFCVLGGSRCVDGGVKTPGECTASRFCAPQSVCAACRPLTGEAGQDCVRDPFVHSPTPQLMFGIACHVATKRNPLNASDPITFCGTAIPLVGPVRQMAINVTCSNATIGSAGDPPRDRLEIDLMKFRVDVSSTCGFTLTPSGEVSPNLGMEKITGLVTVDLENGRSIALPISIQADPPMDQCTTSAGECNFIGDALDRPPLQCLTAPPP